MQTRELFFNIHDATDLTDSEDEQSLKNEILEGNMKTDTALRFKFE